jgi:hypothetical protein
MRLYNRRFVTRSVERQTQAVQETRDAILWSVDTANKLCSVRVQGSNEYVIAHYPENWEQIPVWLKPGNAVKIMHTGGVRGWVEVVGHGQVVPTPVTGASAPTSTSGVDSILTGCELVELSDTEI